MDNARFCDGKIVNLFVIVITLVTYEIKIFKILDELRLLRINDCITHMRLENLGNGIRVKRECTKPVRPLYSY